MNSSLIRYLLADKESLGAYSSGLFVDFEDVKRRLFLIARDHNRTIPDHYYHLAQENSFDGIHTLSTTIVTGITSLVKDYLELHENRVYVKLNTYNSWQELITYMPPLLLQSAFLYRLLPAGSERRDILDFYRRYILPNTKYTALPGARIPQLDHYVNDKNGLHDLHMHLNGALETDQIWQDYLYAPGSVYTDLNKSFRNVKVKEQLEQESYLLEPSKYVGLLKTAQKLRGFFYAYLFPEDVAPDGYLIPAGTGDAGIGKEQLLNKFLNSAGDYPGNYQHPFLTLITKDDQYPFLVSVEGLMYTLLLRELSMHKNDTLAGFFHFYLLILGLTNRLLVQQVHQNGFEQFQKHTLNGLREKSESIYLRRYFQMHGNESRHIRFLEGRFSPKKTQEELVTFIDAIWNGWGKMKDTIGLQEEDDNIKPSFKEPELKLIAHFIKEGDTGRDLFIRHKKLRNDTWQKAKVLSLLLHNYPEYKKKVVAVDAAASEFDAPPEVFAPVFRFMRRSGMKHFTYHAGEDFYHIISGLRAVYEAIIFCDLQKGDRIGHATATGISSRHWSKHVGNEILIRQGEYLDNLVFAYHLIVNFKIVSLQSVIPSITNKVQDLSYEIYNKHYPITMLEKAWLMRQCCPVHAFGENRADAGLLHIFNAEEWDYMINAGFVDDRVNMRKNKVWKIFSSYHDSHIRKISDKIIRIDPFEVFSGEGIEALQLGVLAFMNRNEIVIETLPTSNVRIGFHRGFESYHLWNWIRWQQEGNSIPPIVVGSDDTGIFATNIYNEYANIYCFLLNHCKLSHAQVMDVIKKLDTDSHVYRFE